MTRPTVKNIFSLVSGILVVGLLAWLFTLQGTPGFLQVDLIGRIAFIILALVGLGIFGLILASFFNRTLARRVTSPLFVAAIPLFLLTVAAIIYLLPFRSVGDTLPQLLLTDVMGQSGLPDFVVSFNTGQLTMNSFRFGEINQEQAFLEHIPVGQHVFKLENLEPDANYWYQINDGTIYNFRTPPVGDELRFAVGSDAHYGAGSSDEAARNKMISQIADPSNGYRLFFSLGDLVHLGFSAGQWNEALNGISAATSKIPSVFCAGNHDTLLGGMGRYEKYVCSNGTSNNSGSKLWHRYDIGRVHFLQLDLEWSAEAFTTEQSEWLIRELEEIPKKDWTVVMGHGFYYASGSVVNGWEWYDNGQTIQSLSPIFEKYGVDLVFSGHAHQMEMLRHNEVNYVICGSFGGQPDQERDYSSPAGVWYLAGMQGFVDVSLAGDVADVKIRNTDGDVLFQTTILNNR